MAKSALKSGTYWLYGRHPVEAALNNPERRVRAIRVAGRELPGWLAAHRKQVQLVEAAQIDRLVGRDAVHQGVAAEVDPLRPPALEEIMPLQAPLMLLDQVTDPHNVGAILRSAAAFGIAALVAPKDHSPAENAVMAKAASGALEQVSLVTVTNLASAMQQLKQAGYWLAGLDGAADKSISALSELSPVAIVLGAEGRGLRPRTRQECDLLVRIPMSGAMESLNVSNAAAIAGFVLQQGA